jgi:hypothetical protein
VRRIALDVNRSNIIRVLIIWAAGRELVARAGA